MQTRSKVTDAFALGWLHVYKVFPLPYCNTNLINLENFFCTELYNFLKVIIF